VVQGLHVDITNIGNYVESLVADVVGHNYTMSEPERAALKVIQELVSKMQNASIIQHAEDQAELDTMRDLVQNCSLDAAAALRGDVAARKQSMIASRASHAACRGDEGVMKDAMEIACSLYDFSRKSSSPPSCLSTDLTTDFVQATEVVKRKQMEACLELVHGWLPPVYDKYSNCTLKKEGHENRTNDCNTKQHLFEQAFCSYESKLEDACDFQTNCRTSSVAARNEAYKGVKASEAARKADFSASKRLLCFMDVLKANNTHKKKTLQECRSLTTDASKFDLTYHNIPDAAACNKEQQKPCSSGWNTAEYETQLWYNKSKIATCHPCIQPTSTTTTMMTTTTTTMAKAWTKIGAGVCRDDAGKFTPWGPSTETDSSARDKCAKQDSCLAYAAPAPGAARGYTQFFCSTTAGLCRRSGNGATTVTASEVHGHGVYCNAKVSKSAR
jgi:hypothetical protein